MFKTKHLLVDIFFSEILYFTIFYLCFFYYYHIPTTILNEWSHFNISPYLYVMCLLISVAYVRRGAMSENAPQGPICFYIEV